MDCITIFEAMLHLIDTNQYFRPLVILHFILARKCRRAESRDWCEPNPCNLVRQKCSSKRFTCVPDYCGKCRADVYDFTGKRTRKCLSKRIILIYFVKLERFCAIKVFPCYAQTNSYLQELAKIGEKIDFVRNQQTKDIAIILTLNL